MFAMSRKPFVISLYCIAGYFSLLPAVGSAAEYALSSEQFVGDVGYATVGDRDTFSAMARRYELGYEEMRLANPDMDPWLPLAGAVVTLPTRHLLPLASRDGVVINVAEYRLYHFSTDADGQAVVNTYPISIGRQQWLTPLGKARVVKKRVNPTWFPPKSVIAEHAERGEILGSSVPPGPDNPLGTRSLRLSIPGYLIHGTNKPSGVGMRVTHGCIRLYPENIEALYPQVPIGTPVEIVNQPYKFAYVGDELFFQAYPSLEPEDDAYARSLTRVMEVFVQVADSQSTDVDWDALEYAYQNPTGLPVRVGQRKSGSAELVAQDSAN